LLSAHGLTIVEPVVDELITSFDMAGISLTLFRMNDELEQTWLAAADTPAFHRGNVVQSNENKANPLQLGNQHRLKTGSAVSQAAATVVLAALEAAYAAIDAKREELGRLDAIAGDGDHGIGMQRGLAAAVAAAKEALDAKAGAGTLLTVAGDAWSNRAGGTSGALWGVILRSLGGALGDEAKPDVAAIADGIAAAFRGVTDLGKAQLGDKTLVDVLHPISVSMDSSASRNLSVVAAWNAAADVADAAAQATGNLLPKIGRARPHAEKSIGTPDPGAVSMALIVRSIAVSLKKHCAPFEN
jgi:dihydroxyacetone kinase